MNSEKKASLAFIFVYAGRYQAVEGSAEITLQSLEVASRILDAEIIIGFDSPEWQGTPTAQTLTNRFVPGALKIFFSEKKTTLAEVYNQGAKLANANYISFLYPGCQLNIENFQKKQIQLEQAEFDLLAYVDDKYSKDLGVSLQQLSETFLGYFLSVETLFPLCQAVVRSEMFYKLGGFSESPILQRDFDAEFWLRSVYQGARVLLSADELCSYIWSLRSFPLVNIINLPRYIPNSYKLRRSHASSEDLAIQEFINDSDDEALTIINSLYANFEKELSPYKGARVKKYKIALPGGGWVYVHNKLCFFNPLRALEGKGEFTYFPIFDFDSNVLTDLLGVDCVIISRGRHNNVLKILEYCKNYQIPIIYMIDDNWFSVGRDYPEPYASIFAPGLPAYEVFLTCIRESDAVLVYNQLLEDDVKKYTENTLRLNVNISINDFLRTEKPLGLFSEKIKQLNEWREETGGVIIGYAGSARYSNSAFQALVSIGREFPEKVRLLLFGVFTPEQKEIFKNSSVDIFPYVSYEAYGSMIAQLKPDILIAPLEPSRTSQSKCPNKYLEYSVIGAVGVYSNLSPYSDVISNGINGALVDVDNVENWKSAIIELMNDPHKMKSMAENANNDVRNRYETSVVAPTFALAIRSVILSKDKGL